jgi:hypothetical protein
MFQIFDVPSDLPNQCNTLYSCDFNIPLRMKLQTKRRPSLLNTEDSCKNLFQSHFFFVFIIFSLCRVSGHHRKVQ